MPEIKLPYPQEGKDLQDTVNNLLDTQLIYRKELEFLLLNLDNDNVPELDRIVGDIDGLHTRITQTETDITLLAQDVSGNTSSINVNAEQITLLSSDIEGNKASIKVNADNISLAVSDIEGNTAAIQVNSDNITSLVSDVEGNTSSISQNATNIELKVSKDGVISSINQTAETIKIAASKIDLSGYVTVTDLSGSGTTTIDGSNITTGTIAAERLELTGYITATDLSTGGSTTINGSNITTGSISADRISGGTISGVTINIDTEATVGDTLNVGPGGNNYTAAINLGGATLKNIYTGNVEISSAGAYKDLILKTALGDEMTFTSGEINLNATYIDFMGNTVKGLLVPDIKDFYDGTSKIQFKSDYYGNELYFRKGEYGTWIQITV